jgi:hypothetical protein
LATTNLSLPGRTQVRKLFPKYIGPFPIQQVISDVAYRLQLPEHIKIHPVFHVSQLRPFHTNDNLQFPGRAPPPPPPVITDAGPSDVIAELVDRRTIRRGQSEKTQYLVTFRNQPLHEARWVDTRVVELQARNEDVADDSGGGLAVTRG